MMHCEILKIKCRRNATTPILPPSSCWPNRNNPPPSFYRTVTAGKDARRVEGLGPGGGIEKLVRKYNKSIKNGTKPKRPTPLFFEKHEEALNLLCTLCIIPPKLLCFYYTFCVIKPIKMIVGRIQSYFKVSSRI